MFFQTDIIFFEHIIVYTVKFGKCFEEFMIPIALLNDLGGKIGICYLLLKLVKCEYALAKRINSDV